MKQELVVLRLSPRGYRDLRITTHACLVARAFGAERIILDEEQDPNISTSLQKINHQFGGTFRVEYCAKPLYVVKQMKKEGWKIVHLTMYGEKPLPSLQKIHDVPRILLVVGANKVPMEMYHLADYNISITRQPHSEIAALGVAMHYLQHGKEESLTFEGGKNLIVPTPHGKKVVKKLT